MAGERRTSGSGRDGGRGVRWGGRRCRLRRGNDPAALNIDVALFRHRCATVGLRKYTPGDGMPEGAPIPNLASISVPQEQAWAVQ